MKFINLNLNPFSQVNRSNAKKDRAELNKASDKILIPLVRSIVQMQKKTERN